jgi:hypothetical protein
MLVEELKRWNFKNSGLMDFQALPLRLKGLVMIN